MPEIEIRPAVASDIPVIVAFDHSYQSSYVWQIDIVQDGGQVNVNFREVRLPRSVRVDYPRAVKNLLSDWKERSVVLVAARAGAPVGYLSVTDQIAPNTAWVSDLAVAPEIRRQGVGSALLLAAQEWAAQRKNRRMIVEMQSKNYPAVKMMKKLGFEFAGYNDHYYANQDIALYFAQFIR